MGPVRMLFLRNFPSAYAPQLSVPGALGVSLCLILLGLSSPSMAFCSSIFLSVSVFARVELVCCNWFKKNPGRQYTLSGLSFEIGLLGRKGELLESGQWMDGKKKVQAGIPYLTLLYD